VGFSDVMALLQTVQILVALAFIAYVLMAATGVVLFVTQVLFPRLSERTRRRLGS